MILALISPHSVVFVHTHHLGHYIIQVHKTNQVLRLDLGHPGKVLAPQLDLFVDYSIKDAILLQFPS